MGPPTVGNLKVHKTNRLWAQVEVKPNSHIFWVRTGTTECDKNRVRSNVGTA